MVPDVFRIVNDFFRDVKTERSRGNGKFIRFNIFFINLMLIIGTIGGTRVFTFSTVELNLAPRLKKLFSCSTQLSMKF